MPAKPPIHCTPCRVTYNGQRYRILSNGGVAETPTPQPKPADVGVATIAELLQWEIDNLTWRDAHSTLAREVRHEASRLRRNRNARERNQALRSLGMTKTPYGWE